MQLIPTDQIVDLLTRELKELRLCYVFGSFAQGSQQESSDIDIAVLCNEPLDNEIRWEVAHKIAALLNRDIDLVDLHNCSTVLALQVVTSGNLLFNDGYADIFEMVTLSMYQHLQESWERSALSQVEEH